MNYRIEEKSAFRIVGISAPLDKDIEKNFDVVPKMWQQVTMKGVIPRLVQSFQPQKNSFHLDIFSV